MQAIRSQAPQGAKPRVAIVEDERRLAAALKEGLEAEGYSADVFHDGAAAEAGLSDEAGRYDLALLDLALPSKDGYQVADALRRRGVTTPILVLTARDAAQDKVRALDGGADDFMTKPFAFEELLARMRAILRRASTPRPAELARGDFRLELDEQAAYRAGERLPLTQTEFRLLRLLLERAGGTLSREEIAMRLWPSETPTDSNVVDVHIRNLRKKISHGHPTDVIRTVRGAGYALQA